MWALDCNSLCSVQAEGVCVCVSLRPLSVCLGGWVAGCLSARVSACVCPAPFRNYLLNPVAQLTLLVITHRKIQSRADLGDGAGSVEPCLFLV